MSTLHIANYREADRVSAVAGEVMTPGMIVKVSADATGQRKLLKLLDADSALLVAGSYAIVTKEMVDAEEVEVSTANTTLLGSRTVSIASGDAVLELRRGVKIEVSPDLLHSSLDPSQGGTLPAAGDSLFIKSSTICRNTGVAGSIASPIVLKCFRTFGSGSTAKVVIELV
jgi:hypothetical protein